MDLTTKQCLEEGTTFLETLCDPVCKLNLKETSEFVKSFPLANATTTKPRNNFLEFSSKDTNSVITKRTSVEAPSTPGRPIFNFSNGTFPRKNCPSKWDDAQKWLVNGSTATTTDHHHHHHHPSHNESSKMYSKQCTVYNNKPRVCVEKDSTFQGPFVPNPHNDPATKPVNEVSLSNSTQVLPPKDKFPNRKLGCSEPMQEGFLFENAVVKSMNDTIVVETVPEAKQHRDVGTEMTPVASSPTSRCPTPFKSTSPARHNTPDNRSVSFIHSSNTIDITKLEQCDFAKIHIGSQYDSLASNWSSRDEEEEDVSKSLRHFEMSSELHKGVSESRSAWEEEEKTKSCLRYEREEARIQAWVNLQSAKAEAESRKLEVKIQKMRSDLEEKLMKRMADVHRKAEEWRAAAQFHHSEQIRKVDQQARKAKIKNNNNRHFSGNKSCGCFPCNNHI